MTKRSRSQAKLPCVSKVKPYLSVQSTAIFHNLVQNASSMPSLLLCQWNAGKVNWEDSKNCELKISAGVPTGELKAAMLWRQTIVLLISKSGNALDWLLVFPVENERRRRIVTKPCGCSHRRAGNGLCGGYGYEGTRFKVFKQHWSDNGPDGRPYNQDLRRSQAKRPEKVEKIGRSFTWHRWCDESESEHEHITLAAHILKEHEKILHRTMI